MSEFTRLYPSRTNHAYQSNHSADVITGVASLTRNMVASEQIADNSPVAADNSPVSADNSPVSADISPVSADNSTVSSDNSPVSEDDNSSVPLTGFYGKGDCKDMDFLVYDCLQNDRCKGWGDRQRGIVSVFLLAQLTNRRFVLIHERPCSLLKFLAPNSYNWTYCLDYVLSRPESHIQRFIYFNKRIEFQNRISESDFELVFHKQVVFIKTNQFWIDAVLAHKRSADNVAWAVGKTKAEIFKQVLSTLFKPRDVLNDDINKYLNNVNERQTLVCSHIRVGENPSMPRDKKRPYPNVELIFQFLETFDNQSDYVLYVASDSEQTRERAKRTFNNSFTVDLPIVHVDRYVSKRNACQGLFTALLEQYLLSKCDIVLLTHGGFGKIATYMSEKQQRVLYVDLENNTILEVDP